VSHPNTPNILIIDADLLGFQKFVSSKTAQSSRKLRTASYLWTRFLSSLITLDKPKKPAPANFAKWNDGFGETGISLNESMQGIKQYIRGEA